MINAVSIDLEFWYSGEPFSNYLKDKVDIQIEDSTEFLLNLLNKYNVRATFFVLGKLAEDYPSLIKTIHKQGHEISSHSYSHKKLYMLNKDSFEIELKKSIELLESITGEKPIGFRAPNFSIDNSTKWVFRVLEKYGFKYDSSIYPIRTQFYGVPNAPLEPYKLSMDDITKIDDSSKIIEFPLSVVKIIKNVPIAGGFYFRILPLSFIKLAIKKVNKDRPIIIYVHPWEIYPKTPKVNIPFPINFISYYKMESVFKKFENLLKNFKFAPIKEVLQL